MRIFAWCCCVILIGYVEYTFLQTEIGKLVMSGHATWKEYGFGLLATIPLGIFCIFLGAVAGHLSYKLTLIGWVVSVIIWLVLFVWRIAGPALTDCMELLLWINGTVGRSLFWGFLFSI